MNAEPLSISLKALVFDVFGTVVDWRSSVIAEGQEFGKAKGIDIDWAGFADSWRSIYRPFMDKVQNGELPWTKLDDLHRMMLNQTLSKYGVGNLTDDEKEHFNRVWHRLKPWPDSAPGLQRLKQRYVISTLSNGNISLLTNMAKYAGLPWDCILSAENVQRYKPDPQVYLLAPRLFDLKPDQVMMVAAHEHDLQSAAKHGLRTAFVHRPTERGPSTASAMPPADRYDLAVTDFAELASTLGA